MITDEDVYAYLEHHGVKGMRWGVRKGRSSGGGSKAKPKKQRKPLTPDQKANIVAGAAVVAAGALIARQMLRNHNVKMARIASSQRNLARTASVVNNLGGIKISEIRTGFSVGSSGVASPIMRKVVTL